MNKVACTGYAALAALALIVAGCGSTAPAPTPFSAAPAPAGSAVAPTTGGPASGGPASGEATGSQVPSPPASPSAVTSRTVVTPSPVVKTTKPALPALRLTYPGIRKLVILKSAYNDTPGGRAALNTVAAYYSLLDTMPQLKTVAPLQELSARECRTCAGDAANSKDIIAKGLRYSSPSGDIRYLRVSLTIEDRGADTFSIQSTAEDPPLMLIDPGGKIITRAAAGKRTSSFLVRVAGTHALVTSLFDLST